MTTKRREVIPPAGTEYDPRMGVPHIINGVEHDAHPGEPCAAFDTVVRRYVAGDLLCTRLSPNAQCQWLDGHYGGCVTT